eukprot:TRINITY_DN2043_c0_g1_i4.p1 TRINITY_DN2043_c0_g1~~TRINITY_DN2043_c0_g1_i4.p1  ORF type:complete len:177 (+),score=29.56 TRINITY_DN2043_c0_g1_i4:73-603(+)
MTETLRCPCFTDPALDSLHIPTTFAFPALHLFFSPYRHVNTTCSHHNGTLENGFWCPLFSHLPPLPPQVEPAVVDDDDGPPEPATDLAPSNVEDLPPPPTTPPPPPPVVVEETAEKTPENSVGNSVKFSDSLERNYRPLPKLAVPSLNKLDDSPLRIVVTQKMAESPIPLVSYDRT